MLLKIQEPLTDTAQTLTVKRDKDARRKWLEFYKSGKRLVTISDPSGVNVAVLNAPPEEKGASLCLSIEPAAVMEVWGGVAGELSSLYVKLRTGCFYGERINGWRFKPAEPPRGEFHRPSPVAESALGHFTQP